MATVIISSAGDIPFGAQLKINNNTSGVIGTTTPTSQIVSFDLSALGSNPVIQDVYIRYSSTYTSDDYFFLTAPYKSSKRLKANPPTIMSVLKNYITGDTLELTFKYVGRPTTVNNISVGKVYTFTTHASFDLIFELESEPVTELRSDGSLSATSVDFGQNITFNIEPFRDNFRHQIIYSVGNYIGRSAILSSVDEARAAGQDVDITAKRCIFNAPDTWVTELPNSETGTMKVLLDTLRPVDANDPNTTYTSVGTREYSVQVHVPSDMHPSIATVQCRIINPASLPSGQVFTGVSRLKFTIGSVSGSTGASVASIRYKGWGDTITTTNPASLTNIELTTNVVRSTGNLNYDVAVIDSRGRLAGVVGNIGYAIQYNQPSLVIDACKRCTPAGEDLDRGTAVKIQATFQCDTQAVAGNTVRAYVYIRPEQGTWSNGFELTSGTERILTETDLGYELSHETHYEVRFVLEDNVMTGNMAIELYRATGQNGRLDINPNWTVSMGTDINIGSQTLAEYIQSIVSAMQGS